jgi:hypothetical protein
MNAMCETKNRDALRNGHGGDLTTIGLATADVIDALIGVQAQLKEIPTRNEVREMIHSSLQIHVETCDAARDDGGGAVLSLGKGGLSAKGRAGVKAALWVVGLLAALIMALGWVAPRLAELVAAWK